MRAAGYARVSSQDQVDGTSLDAQVRQIEAYATLKGLDLTAVFVDGGVSGGKALSSRPEGGKLTAMVDAGEIEAVIIIKLDRGFRSTIDCLQTIEDWDTRNVALHIVDLGGNSVDTKSPAGKFMMTVLAGAAEMERGMIRDRCNSGRKARKAEGKRIGEVPFGYTVADDNELVTDDAEQDQLNAIISMKASGASLRAIASNLNDRGVKAKKGGAWTHGQVQAILRRVA